MDIVSSGLAPPGRRRSSTNAAFTAAAAAAVAAALPDDDANAALVSFYTRTYPTAAAFASDAVGLNVEEVREAVAELAAEVAALREETEVLATHAASMQQPTGGNTNTVRVDSPVPEGASAASGGNSAQDVVSSPVDREPSAGVMVPSSTSTSGNLSRTAMGGSSGTRRGRSFRRRSLGAVDLFMRVEDKLALMRQETTHLNAQEAATTKESEGVHELLAATVEEAVKRRQELQLEMLQLLRDVVGDESALDGDSTAPLSTTTADDLLRYLERRHTTQTNYLDKLEVQCQAVEQDITRAQQLVRQRRIAGEAFQLVDLEQLRIEHKQFTERMAARNGELAELKGTSTRTVQQLNQLMGQLNKQVGEQARLKKESKSRNEFLSRCDREIGTATAQAALAESKHDTLRAQQESIRAPKIEAYMAQKAEEAELEKAVKNWERKVQILEGQAAVMRQQSRRMQRQRNEVVLYASEKQHKQQQRQHSLMELSSKPLVGGTRSLLQQRRQQQQQPNAAYPRKVSIASHHVANSPADGGRLPNSSHPAAATASSI